MPLSEFRSGGPGKDGIPALDRPRFLHVSEASFLQPQEPVIALTHAGRARAYPLQILVWHEIVNNLVGGVPIAVTFCPLCNTAIAFDRRVRGRTLTFGTAGNLRNSDLVMVRRRRLPAEHADRPLRLHPFVPAGLYLPCEARAPPRSCHHA